jgi:hypothetical protein
MKFLLAQIVIFSFMGIALKATGQYNWKLIRDVDGIKVYESKTKNSSFKSIKVECTLPGNFDKFARVLSDVPHYKDWVYRTKTAYLVKRISGDEFYYYTETILPWPMSNRDVVFHSKTSRDSLNRYLNIQTTSVPLFIPEKNGKVRVPYSSISWYVTMPGANTIHVVYIFVVDPGGNIPAWLVNMFSEKGPYESFKKLSEILRK